MGNLEELNLIKANSEFVGKSFFSGYMMKASFLTVFSHDFLKTIYGIIITKKELLVESLQEIQIRLHTSAKCLEWVIRSIF